MVGEAIGAGCICARCAWRNGDANGLGAVGYGVAVGVLHVNIRRGGKCGAVDGCVVGWVHGKFGCGAVRDGNHLGKCG